MKSGDVEVSQSLIEHLTELRQRLIYSAYGIVAGFLVSWTFSEKLFDLIRRPIQPFLPQGGLVFTAPMDKFLAYVKVSFLAGVILSCPLWVYQLWRFVAPGLYKNEKKFATAFIFSGSVLFMTGVCFVYFVVFPMAFHFLMTFGGKTDSPMITIDHYLSFFTTTTLVFGLAFEMPLILVILGQLGIIDHKFLQSKRRYAVVLMAGLSAIITPPDALSMLMMLIPLLALYEISILVVSILQKPPAPSSPASPSNAT